jgi:hypothetical protein
MIAKLRRKPATEYALGNAVTGCITPARLSNRNYFWLPGKCES